MVRKVEVIVPNKRAADVYSVVKGDPSVHHIFMLRGEELSLISFKIVNKKTDEIIDKLTRYGVANAYGSIAVSSLNSSRPRISTLRTRKNSKRLYRTSDRMSYDEIYEIIDSNLHLTFDYLALVVVAAMISAAGILTDSSVTVVASMLVSPLMGPILGMTFGSVANEREMVRKSFRNELIGILLCCFVGLIYGLLSAVRFNPHSDYLAFGENTQMSSRGELSNLVWGALVAVPSGLGVALGVTGDVSSALIGTAISAALLPPIVNTGIALGMGLVYAAVGHSSRVLRVYFRTASVSFALFLINWGLIFVCGILMFRLKRLDYSAKTTSAKTQRNLGKFNEALMEHEADDDTVSTEYYFPPLSVGKGKHKVSDDMDLRLSIASKATDGSGLLDKGSIDDSTVALLSQKRNGRTRHKSSGSAHEQSGGPSLVPVAAHSSAHTVVGLRYDLGDKEPPEKVPLKDIGEEFSVQ